MINFELIKPGTLLSELVKAASLFQIVLLDALTKLDHNFSETD